MGEPRRGSGGGNKKAYHFPLRCTSISRYLENIFGCRSVVYTVGVCVSVCVSVPCEDNRKKVAVKRVNRFDESIDTYTEFYKPYELTSFDDTFSISMTNSAR